jgi:hypothetical protein
MVFAALAQLLILAAIGTFRHSARHVGMTVGLLLAGDVVVFSLLAVIAVAFQRFDFPEHRRTAVAVHLLLAAALAWATWAVVLRAATGRGAIWSGAAMLAATFAGLTLPGVRTSGSHRPAQVTVTSVAVPGLPAELEGFRILLLSDIHIGPYTDAAAARATLRPLARVTADLVAFTGDLASGEKPGIGVAASLLDELAPHGVRFAVLGNHEHYLDPGLATRELARRGFHVLNNRSERVGVNGQDIWVVGVDDPYTGSSDLPKAFAGAPTDAFVILLAHTPDVVAQPLAERANLILAGHTHGGQIVLPLVGPLTSNSRYGIRYASGLFDVNGSRLFVTRGLGEVNIPLRVLCPPEIALLLLERARN